MGIDLHNLNFLAHAQDLGVCFGRTVAIGRQVLFVDPPELAQHRAWRGLPALQTDAAGGPPYFEPLLRHWFGAAVTDSVDASPYEQATLLHDMNLPWPVASPQCGHYDAVLDFGCLEHVFDFPTAWRNVTGLCRVGGHVLHALPMNNLSGHGFYQFSPELFCNLYQPARGFELRALYAVMKAEPRSWWKVVDPLAVRRRVTLCNGQEVYLLVLARKLHEADELPAPQQSDYALTEWQSSHGGSPATAAPSPWGAPLAALGLLDAARRWRHRVRGWAGAGLALPSPDYERIAVADLLRRRDPPGA